jgi:DNA invertase Pin-like site-specific DNA recombinase
MKLIAYLRVSTDDQADAYGLDAQEAAVRAWAKANGHQILYTASDVGLSGVLPPEERPGLAEALDALQPPPKANGLVIHRLDRLARTFQMQEAVLQMAWKAGASVFSADQGEIMRDDPDDPLRTAVRQIIGVISELDRKLVIKRMREGKRAKAAAGRHAEGAYPYGYAGKGEGKMRDKAPNPDEQKAVNRIIELRKAGSSYRVIAEQLDAEGLRPRRAASWSAMSVRNIAERELASASRGSGS